MFEIAGHVWNTVLIIATVLIYISPNPSKAVLHDEIHEKHETNEKLKRMTA